MGCSAPNAEPALQQLVNPASLVLPCSAASLDYSWPGLPALCSSLGQQAVGVDASGSFVSGLAVVCRLRSTPHHHLESRHHLLVTRPRARGRQAGGTLQLRQQRHQRHQRHWPVVITAD